MKKIILLILLSLLIVGCDLDSDLNTYTDENYEMSIGYSDDFTYESDGQNMIFSSELSESYYVLSVIFSSNTGGVLSTLEDVQNQYLAQFSQYGVELLGSATGKINGFEAIDFVISYTFDDIDYINRFVIGKDDKYFYVLQFIIPASDYDSQEEFIGMIIESFEFGEQKQDKKGLVGGQFDTDSGSNTNTNTNQDLNQDYDSEEKQPIVPPTIEPETISPSECYDEYKQEIDDARAHNLAQDPAIEAGGVSVLFIGKVDSCVDAYNDCWDASEAAYDECPPNAQGNFEDCIEEDHVRTINCALAEVACTESYYMNKCGLTNVPSQTPNQPETPTNNDAEECYEWYAQHFASLRAQHAAQDPYSSSIGLPYDNTEECWTVVRECNDAADAAYDSCAPDASGSYKSCMVQENIDKLDCVMLSIECGENFHKKNCGLI